VTTATAPATTLALETFRAQRDGCLGYLVVDGASRTDAVAARPARLTYVLDTHTPADHLSCVRGLARRTGHAASKLKGPARRIRGGETFELGTKAVTVIDAPGHTPDSMALLVDGHLFTGDALFPGGAGRTDFVGGSPSDLFDTFRTFEALPEATVVHPGHDCVGRPVTTIGEEKAGKPLLREPDRAALVARLSAEGTPPAKHGRDPAAQPRRGRGVGDHAGGGPGPPPPRAGAVPAKGAGASPSTARCSSSPAVWSWPGWRWGRSSVPGSWSFRRSWAAA
jgi:glyoxylase-like metal-dependent hydrolase (beta-lactamase superfamily II)